MCSYTSLSCYILYADAVLSYLDESVSTVSVIVEPLLEQIRYTQFSNTVHTTFDSTLVLTVIVETAAGECVRSCLSTAEMLKCVLETSV